jgi:hypothetical protein
MTTAADESLERIPGSLAEGFERSEGFGSSPLRGLDDPAPARRREPLREPRIRRFGHEVVSFQREPNQVGSMGRAQETQTNQACTDAIASDANADWI